MNSELDNIINICNYISRSKSAEEIDIILIEELSELIKVVTKLERWTFGDEFLRCEYKDIIDKAILNVGQGKTTYQQEMRCNYHDIYNNIYEELADVIIMIIQFIDKNEIEHKELLNKICEKITRYFETKAEQE